MFQKLAYNAFTFEQVCSRNEFIVPCTYTYTDLDASLSPSPQRQWRQMREKAWDQGWFKITRLWHKVQWGTHGGILPHDPYIPGVVSSNGKA